MTMSNDDLAQLPSRLMAGFNEYSECTPVHQVLRQLNDLSLENCGLAVTVEDILRVKPEDNELLEHFDKFMPEKKTHEVCAMATFVNNLTTFLGVDSLLDIGSGKGYLSQVLAALYDIPVLAVDSQVINRVGAEKREENLTKRWDGLQRRAGDRADGIKPRTSKQLKKLGSHVTQQDQHLEKLEKRQVVHLTKFVTEDSDLSAILTENLHLNENTEHAHGIIGLHTCGNLAAASIKIFLSSKKSRFICNVGCCYHHLDEHFFVNPFVDWSTDPQFPMSRKLMEKKFWIGRNARMLAAQPLDRLATNLSLPTKSLLWRSILQVMFRKYAPDLSFRDQQIGRIASKSKDFIDYTRKAFKKVGFENEINNLSDENIQEIYTSYNAQYERKLNAFYQFRLMFAPLVEAIILTDRLLFLSENPLIEKAYLVRLFDSNISPRSYAIVGIKKS